MKLALLPIALLACASILSAQTSTWVYPGSDNRLQYRQDDRGNRIMDFSYAGYQGGGVALPIVPVAQAVNPIGGDNTQQIQAAIDAVSALTPDAHGFRGAVLLEAGSYDISGTLNITASGVVLRGSGSGPGGSVLNMRGSPHLLFSVAGTGSWQKVGTAAAITDTFLPSGAMSFHVNDASGFAVGGSVLIGRPVTPAWIHLMGMDLLKGGDGKPQTWIGPGTIVQTDRTIAAIDGNAGTLDAPLADSFDSVYLDPPGGSLTAYTFDGRISQVGVEHLSVVAPAVNVDINLPQFLGLSMNAVMDAWVSDVLFQDTQNTVTIGGTVKRVTLDNVHVNHTVVHTGDRMTDFGLSGTQALFNRCSSDGDGEWPFVTQSRVSGPSVVLNFTSTQQAGIGPHQRWAVGLLTDNATLPNAPANSNGGATGISYSDRGNHGSGQGWAMGWGVVWNVTTPFFVVQEPPGAHNWCIGCIGKELTATEAGSGVTVPNGIYESIGVKVTPNSLYLAQMCDRLGSAAVANIGYAGACAADLSNRVSVTATGFVFSRVSGTFNGTLSVNNTGGQSVSSPIEIVLANLPAGVTLVNASGTSNGNPFIAVPGASSLSPGQSATVNVQFRNPSNTSITFTPTAFSGSL
jgi:hypothetical protein